MKVELPDWAMTCTNCECGVTVYNPMHDVALSCPGCDYVGMTLAKWFAGVGADTSPWK